MTRIEQLEAKAARIDAALDAAYWRFTRTARAAPPAVACPGAYERREAIRRELRDLRAVEAVERVVSGMDVGGQP